MRWSKRAKDKVLRQLLRSLSNRNIKLFNFRTCGREACQLHIAATQHPNIGTLGSDCVGTRVAAPIICKILNYVVGLLLHETCSGANWRGTLLLCIFSSVMQDVVLNPSKPREVKNLQTWYRK
jgi:hypothetical protein